MSGETPLHFKGGLDQRKRPDQLSITHIFRCFETKDDVGEARQATPHDDIAWWRVTVSREVTAQSRNFSNVNGQRVRLICVAGRDKVVEQVALAFF